MVEYIEREKALPALWTDEPISGTEFMTHNQGQSGFEIHFRTDDKVKYEAVQDECRRQIDHAKPAADVRPVVRGKWEEVEVVWLADIEEQPDAIASMFCPKCKRFANHVYHYGDPTHGMNFCPNCGADMREES